MNEIAILPVAHSRPVRLIEQKLGLPHLVVAIPYEAFAACAEAPAGQIIHFDHPLHAGDILPAMGGGNGIQIIGGTGVEEAYPAQEAAGISPLRNSSLSFELKLSQ
jgi:hypothetical protein